MLVNSDKPFLCPVIIGRNAYLEKIKSTLGQVQSGKGQLVLLGGEAGLGKSRLAGETKQLASRLGWRTLQGNCFETDLSYPYAPLGDLLHTFLVNKPPEEISHFVGAAGSELAKLLPELATWIPGLVLTSHRLEPEQEKRRLFQAFAQFFIRLASFQPLLIILEDLHWSDDISLEFVLYLSRRSLERPIMLLVTYRIEEIHPRLRHWLAQLDREHLAQELFLAPLTRPEAEAMVQAILELHWPGQAQLLDAIYTLTEGNPFFIEEMLKTLITAGTFFNSRRGWQTRARWELAIPRSLQDAVLQRFERLSEPSRHLALQAAVAGRRFDLLLLKHLTHSDEAQLLGLIKELIAAQLVIEETAERFTFRHALTRQAIYAQLLGRERQILHQAVAETIEQLYPNSLEGYLPELAYHYYQAAQWPQALEFGRRAGERSQALYSLHEAVEYFTQALEAAHQLSVRPALHLFRARGKVYESMGEFELARKDQEEALALARQIGNDRAEWQALLDLGLLWASRDYSQTGGYVLVALEQARLTGDSSNYAHTLNRLGTWHMSIDEPLAALKNHREALEIFQNLEDRSGQAETLDLMGAASYLSGDLILGTRYLRQAINLFGELDDRPGLVSSLATLTEGAATYQSIVLVPAEVTLAEVARQGELAVKIAREIGQRSGEAFSLLLLGACQGCQGNYGQALHYTRTSLEIAKEIEHRAFETNAHNILGALYLDLLILPEARRHLEQALALAKESKALFYARMVAGYLALTYIRLQEWGRAETLLNDMFNPEVPILSWGKRLGWLGRAEFSLARGDPAQALRNVDQLIAATPNISPERCVPILSKLRGEILTVLHRMEEAEIVLQAACEVATVQGARPLLWRLHLTLGKLYQHQARHEEAKGMFASAHRLITELAANLDDETLRETFLRKATGLIPADPLSSGHKRVSRKLEGLTRREREVAALVAQGESNRRIAEALVLSERTTEGHVSNILSKLGLASRTQIAAWFVEKELNIKN